MYIMMHHDACLKNWIGTYIFLQESQTGKGSTTPQRRMNMELNFHLTAAEVVFATPVTCLACLRHRHFPRPNGVFGMASRREIARIPKRQPSYVADVWFDSSPWFWSAKRCRLGPLSSSV